VVEGPSFELVESIDWQDLARRGGFGARSALYRWNNCTCHPMS
jgi:hypothetical protein